MDTMTLTTIIVLIGLTAFVGLILFSVHRFSEAERDQLEHDNDLEHAHECNHFLARGMAINNLCHNLAIAGLCARVEQSRKEHSADVKLLSEWLDDKDRQIENMKIEVAVWSPTPIEPSKKKSTSKKKPAKKSRK